METKRRSLLKALSWRFLATAITTIIAYILSGELRFVLAAPSPCQQPPEHLAERHDSAPRSTRVVAATDRWNAASSAPSWRRPAAVIL